MALRMQKMEKSFKTDYAIRNCKEKKVFVQPVEPVSE
jgi:hypothetical protein